MTTTDTAEGRQRERRILDLLDRRDGMSRDEAAAVIDEQLEAEAVERAENEARSREFTESLEAFWQCGACGQNAGPGARDGLCPSCRPVVAQVTAERRAAELVGDISRRTLAERYLDRRSTQ